MAFDSAKAVAISDDGQLRIRTGEGVVMTHSVPQVYQRRDGEHHAIAGEFVTAEDGSLAFNTDPFDHDHDLVIDPTISFSTFVGGSDEDYVTEIALGPDGDIHVTGVTESLDFPSAEGLPPGEMVRGEDIFVARLSADGQTLDYVTYLGGESDERAYQLVLDSDENIIVAGYTSSADFPTQAAAQPTFAGGGLLDSDAFVTKLNALGNGLVFSTFLGGIDPFDSQFGYEWIRGLVADAADNLYVVGETSAADFPATHSLNGRGCLEEDPEVSWIGDGFVARFSPAGDLDFAACFGAEDRDTARDVAVAADGSMHIVGFTRSDAFPVSEDALQGNNAGGIDLHITHLSPGATEIFSSTYVGGERDEFAQQIRLLDDGSRLIGGLTASADFPTTFGAYQRVFGGDEDAVVFRMSADASDLMFSTLLGGNDDEDVWSMHVGEDGLIYLASDTASLDFPLVDPLQSERTGGGGLSLVIVEDDLDTTGLDYGLYLDEPAFALYTTIATANNGIDRLFFWDDFETGVFDAVDIGTDVGPTPAIAMVEVDDALGQQAVVVGKGDSPVLLYYLGANPLEGLDPPIQLSSATRDTRAIEVGNLIISPDSGQLDVVIGNYLQPNYFHRGTIDGIGEEVALFSGSEATATTSLRIADMNGDGHADLVEGNDGQPNAIYFSVDGDTFLPATFIDTESDPTVAIAVDDVDQDGDQDLLVGNFGAPNRLYLNDGTGGFDQVVTLDPGPVNTRDVEIQLPFADGPATLIAVDGAAGWAYTYADGQATRLTLTDGSRPANMTSDLLGLTQAGPIGTPIQLLGPTTRDVYLAVLDPAGRELLFSTILGGADSDTLSWGLQVDPDRNAILGGGTSSPDFPTVQPLQAAQAGESDAFLASISLADVALPGRVRFTTVLDLQSPGIEGVDKIVIDWATLDCDATEAADLYDFRLSLIAGPSLVYVDRVLQDGILNRLGDVTRDDPVWDFDLLGLNLRGFSTGVDGAAGNPEAGDVYYRVSNTGDLSPGQLVRVERYENGVLAEASEQMLMSQYTLPLEGDCDADGVNNFADNCLLARNPDQRDSNGDGLGNRCDADLNDDCEVTLVDLALVRAALQSPDEDADFNGDGIVNARDLRVARDALFAPPGPSGVANVCSARP
ncbi:MAG: FG-GAP-like repeat-containing protein [Planctomycetota bacterium]